MNLESYGMNPENLLMAKTDLAVLRDLFHTLNDAGISFSSLNCSIALLEEYIEKTDIESIVTETFVKTKPKTTQAGSYKMWRNSNVIFAHCAV
ncbi:hypothetical protein [Dyadobacter frigoris]|uniref:Uncharacterized protein n=1 Tax=Dyadobacter frigoris TaxID=2576211 RepID=A0A4U6D151_9BACT|nr:hypothetical protein [Dyadobacter frigoris]TKT90940.1 hypothetical protein FDK13_18415 [Dyadobacter frigoris]GLU56695.1 hypothetical protein Dfri01_61560 [Dyadobacter frigoris]